MKSVKVDNIKHGHNKGNLFSTFYTIEDELFFPTEVRGLVITIRNVFNEIF